MAIPSNYCKVANVRFRCLDAWDQRFDHATFYLDERYQRFFDGPIEVMAQYVP